MKPPSLRSLGSVYYLEWPDPRVKARVERLHQHKDGRVTAEITWQTTADGIPPHLHQAQLNLLAGNSKRQLSKLLEEQYPGAAWQEMVEQLCVLSLRQMREGEKVRRLGGDGPIPEIRWQLEPLLLMLKPTLLYADGGTLKSLMALLFGLLMQRDVQHLRLRPTRTNVLFLDWESDWEEQQRRLMLLENGIDLVPKGDVLYRRCYAPFVDDLPEIQQAVIEGNVGYIIVDSLSGACGVDLELQETAAKFFGALAVLNVGSLLISHVPKNASGAGKTPYGSAYWRNYARNTWEARKVQEPGENEVAIGLYHRKSNSGPLQRPLGLRFVFSPDRIVVTRQDVADVPELESGALTHRAKIQVALRHGEMAAKDISEATGLSENAVRTTLLRHAGIVWGKFAEGRWGLLRNNPATSSDVADGGESVGA